MQLNHASTLGRLASLFALALAPVAVFAQHEVDSSASRGPVKINGNENAFGYSDQAMMAIMQELPDINRYAWSETEELIEAISTREMVPENYILPTPGSGPVLMMTAMAYAEEGKNVVTVTPGYLQLVRTFKEFGGSVKEVPLTSSLAHDLDAMAAAVDENTVMVYICNPNNPTGTIVDPEALKAFIRALPEGVLAFVDEAYLELAPGGLEANSMISLVREGEEVLISRTFSKVYGMAGLRIGYGVAKPEILEKLKRYHMGGPNKLGAVAATAAIRDTTGFQRNVENYTRVRSMVTDALDELGVDYADANGSFVFIHTGIPVEEFQSMMEARNVLVGRPFPPMLDWARVSIGTEEEMRIFLQEFERIMRDQGRLAM